MQARRGSGDIAPLSPNLGASWRWVVNITLRPFYPWERTSIPIEVEAGWAPGPFWEWLGMRYSPTGIRNSDHPARSVVAVVTELPRAPYCLINVLILGSLEELTFRKQNVSLPSLYLLLPVPSLEEEMGRNNAKTSDVFVVEWRAVRERDRRHLMTCTWQFSAAECRWHSSRLPARWRWRHSRRNEFSSPLPSMALRIHHSQLNAI